MSSMSIKELSSMMSRGVASTASVSGKQTDAVSFESVWSNQTEKNDSSQVETDENKSVKSDDVSVRDSLKTKDVRKSAVKETEETPFKKPEELSPEELEQAMEVLETTAIQMIEQIAEEFDMTVEEVQSIMAELGMEPLDVLKQENLGELLLTVAGVEDPMALLMDGELYQKYQEVMEQLDTVLEQCGEELQMPVDSVEELLDVLPIEVTVEEDASVEDDAVENLMPEEESDVLDSRETVTETQNGQQMPNQTENHMENHMENNTQSHTESHADSENKTQNVNLVLQNAKSQNFEPQMKPLTGTTLAWDMDTMDIMKQIMDYMKIQVKPDMSHLEMQLHPESLGTLQVNVAAKDGAVTAQFVTQNEAVKAVLESQMIQLKESFAQQGVRVDAIEVTVQTHQFDQNLQQGQNGQFEESDKKSRPRRIQLEDILSMDAMDELEEEEQLAAQMMLANGNTVDYTA